METEKAFEVRMPARLSSEQHPQAEREAWNRERETERGRPQTGRAAC